MGPGSRARALAPEYARLRARPRSSALDAYGAERRAEFFAVAAEAFFEKPKQTRARHPELYAELSDFYRLDPAGPATEPDRADGARRGP